MKNPKEIKAFATRLRIFREKKKWSQDDLANAAEVAKKTVQRIENADNGLTFDTIISLAKALDLPLKVLVDVELEGE